MVVVAMIYLAVECGEGGEGAASCRLASPPEEKYEDKCTHVSCFLCKKGGLLADDEKRRLCFVCACVAPSSSSLSDLPWRLLSPPPSPPAFAVSGYIHSLSALRLRLPSGQFAWLPPSLHHEGATEGRKKTKHSDYAHCRPILGFPTFPPFFGPLFPPSLPRRNHGAESGFARKWLQWEKWKWVFFFSLCTVVSPPPLAKGEKGEGRRRKRTDFFSSLPHGVLSEEGAFPSSSPSSFTSEWKRKRRGRKWSESARGVMNRCRNEKRKKKKSPSSPSSFHSGLHPISLSFFSSVRFSSLLSSPWAVSPSLFSSSSSSSATTFS